MAFSPFMRSVTVGVGISNLATLLAAKDGNFPTRVQFLRIEYDLGGTGDLYIGNSAVAANNCGAHLVASQYKDFIVYGSGLVLTSDIFLISSVAAQQVNITAIPAGA
jgi:hypothetical protein